MGDKGFFQQPPVYPATSSKKLLQNPYVTGLQPDGVSKSLRPSRHVTGLFLVEGLGIPRQVTCNVQLCENVFSIRGQSMLELSVNALRISYISLNFLYSSVPPRDPESCHFPEPPFTNSAVTNCVTRVSGTSLGTVDSETERESVICS